MFLGLLSEQSLHPEYSTELPLPENMYGVDVYGARTRLTTGQLADLYTSFDKAFDARVPPGQRNMDKWMQRRFLLPPNERYLEEIVTRDMFNKFEESRAETGVGPVEYLKMHLDLLNRMLDQARTTGWAKWSVPTSAKFARIIVCEGLDFYRSSFWVENVENKDIDARWITDREDNGLFWITDFDSSGNLIMRSLPGEGEKEKIYVFPKKDDSLTKKGIRLDMVRVHEYFHLLLNLLDEYIMNVEDSPFRFRDFTLESDVMGGSPGPSINPYVMAILKRNYDRKIRGYCTDPLAMGVARQGWGNGFDRMPFWEVPPQINFSADIGGNPYHGIISVFKNGFEPGKYFAPYDGYYTKKIWPKDPNYQNAGEIIFPGPVFQRVTTCPTDYLIRFGDKEIFVPVAIFNMTHWAVSGEEDLSGSDYQGGIPRYKVSFTGFDDPDLKVQRMEYVHKDNLSSYLASYDRVYATLAIVGTPFYAVYSLQ